MRLIFRFGFFGFDVVLDFHVVKFLGIEDFATFQALDKLSVIVPGDYAYSWVFADRFHRLQV